MSRASPEVLAAMERLIASAMASEGLRLLALAAGASIDEQADAARKIANDGMTVEQAKKFRKATDTDEERANIGKIMVAVHPDKADDRLILNWAWAEMNRVLGTEPAPVPTPAPVSSGHYTAFLRDGAKRTSHVFMSEKITDDDRRELIAYNKSKGYTVFYVYGWNEGDYGRRSVSYDHSKKDHWRKWLQAVKDSGARVILWMRADDSPGLKALSDAEWERRVTVLHEDCGDLISEWCTGLEVNEGGYPMSRVHAQTKMIKRVTGKPCGVHTTGVDSWEYAKGADCFYLQCGFGRSPSEIQDKVRTAISRFGPNVILCEYSLSDNAEAAKLAKAGLDAGAKGFGNGGVVPTSQPAPSPSPSNGLTFKLHRPINNYVEWGHADRSGWPVVTQGKKCNGLLYAGLTESDCAKVEWIPVGRENTGIKNALEPGKYYRPEFKPGVKIILQIRDTTGRMRNPNYQGFVIL